MVLKAVSSLQQTTTFNLRHKFALSQSCVVLHMQNCLLDTEPAKIETTSNPLVAWWFVYLPKVKISGFWERSIKLYIHMILFYTFYSLWNCACLDKLLLYAYLCVSTSLMKRAAQKQHNFTKFGNIQTRENAKTEWIKRIIQKHIQDSLKEKQLWLKSNRVNCKKYFKLKLTYSPLYIKFVLFPYFSIFHFSTTHHRKVCTTGVNNAWGAYILTTTLLLLISLYPCITMVFSHMFCLYVEPGCWRI